MEGNGTHVKNVPFFVGVEKKNRNFFFLPGMLQNSASRHFFVNPCFPHSL
jgi:hypothetical protein